jgi:hypothetical protein
MQARGYDVLIGACTLAWVLSLSFALASAPQRSSTEGAPAPAAGRHTSGMLFDVSDNCMACHNGLTTPSGEDISIGANWRATMMANSARDPYWQASVRREVIDHPAAAAEIEDECATCHMPMARTQAMSNGSRGRVFAHLPVGAADNQEAKLAADGVSCTMCHRIGTDRLGTRASFNGGFVVAADGPSGLAPVFGPYPVDTGRTKIMHSATGFVPAESQHIRQSEMCATCHTLYTKARGRDGAVVGELPEQVPYLEWRHSAFRDERSCQSCHMPVVAEPVRFSSVLGELREGVARHSFRGGNFFMLRMLNRYRTELGVEALPQELEASTRATIEHLRTETAAVAIERAEHAGDRLLVEVSVQNLTGHKLPTAYPSRRAWLHLTVRAASGAVVFESGRVTPEGLIAGNDNDADPSRAEPHHLEITAPDAVQIYESIMVDPEGAITTGLLKATGYVKDNRLLPRGFDKASAPRDVAVHGAAVGDRDFSAGGDRVRYVIDTAAARPPFTVDVELNFQPIAYRWAQNLKRYDALEARRFVAYFESMATASWTTLATARARAPER